jgi:hypothetical protein
MPGGEYVHSIRFEPRTDKSILKIIYKDIAHGRLHQYEFRKKVDEYLRSLGYTKISVENA